MVQSCGSPQRLIANDRPSAQRERTGAVEGPEGGERGRCQGPPQRRSGTWRTNPPPNGGTCPVQVHGPVGNTTPPQERTKEHVRPKKSKKINTIGLSMSENEAQPSARDTSVLQAYRWNFFEEGEGLCNERGVTHEGRRGTKKANDTHANWLLPTDPAGRWLNPDAVNRMKTQDESHVTMWLHRREHPE